MPFARAERVPLHAPRRCSTAARRACISFRYFRRAVGRMSADRCAVELDVSARCRSRYDEYLGVSSGCCGSACDPRGSCDASAASTSPKSPAMWITSGSRRLPLDQREAHRRDQRGSRHAVDEGAVRMLRERLKYVARSDHCEVVGQEEIDRCGESTERSGDEVADGCAR